MASLPGAKQVSKLQLQKVQKLPLLLWLLQGVFLAAAHVLRTSLAGAEDERKLKPLRHLFLQLLQLLALV